MNRRLAAASFLLILFLITGCFRPAKPSQPALIGKDKAFEAIFKVLGSRHRLKILALTKFPTGPGYEIKDLEGPGFFVVDAKSGQVAYAALSDVVAKTGGLKYNLKDAAGLAKKWAAGNRVWNGFRYADRQPDYQWPKAGYYTVVWTSASRDRRFAKVTVDLVTGRVVSFGVGDPRWSMFCVPKPKKR